MFSTFARWRRRRRMQKAQAILPYWNGTRTVYGDPFKLWRELIHGGDFVIDDVLIRDVDAGKEPETSKVINHVCKVFAVTRWNPETGDGLTDLEIIGILLSVFQWTNAVKKNTNPGPTSPEPTETPFSTATGDQATAMNAPSDSPSTPAGSTPGEHSA